MTPAQWRAGLKDIPKAKIMPKVKTLVLDIFFRTNWTGYKEFLAYGDQLEAICHLCGEDFEKTFHLFYECIIATRVWDKIIKIIEYATGISLSKTFQMILFHLIPANCQKYKVFLITLFACGKAAINNMRIQETNTPVEKVVINAFLSTQLLTAAKAAIVSNAKGPEWYRLLRYTNEHLDYSMDGSYHHQGT